MTDTSSAPTVVRIVSCHHEKVISELEAELMAWNNAESRSQQKVVELRAEVERLRSIVDICRRQNTDLDDYSKIATNLVDGWFEMHTMLKTAKAERDRYREALVRLRDCDWIITPMDRMDAVRSIAREALLEKK